MQAKRRSRVIADRVLAATFLLFLTIPFVGTFFSWDFYGLQENRRPSPLPDVAETSLEELPDALDAYYKDHFGFRNYLIRRWNRLLRRIDRQLVRRVVEGRDDWFFFGQPEVIHDILGLAETSERDLAAWCRAIEDRRSWLAERGIHYLFVVAPNKSSIYPEMLPEEMQGELRPTRLDRLITYLGANSEARIFDLRPALRENKDWQTLYLSHDTHWSAYGAFIAYRTVLERLREWLPELGPALDFDDCRQWTTQHYGDLARTGDLPEEEYTTPRLWIDPPGHENFADPEFVDPALVPHENAPATKELIPIYANASGHGGVVVFHDSFFAKCVKLIAHHFAETASIWSMLSPKTLIDIVEAQEPQVVIEVVLERFLYEEPLQFDALEKR
ncbi:MAG: alginate O-acetyltransferase AlgX-related protein [Planctomycetota bacterium]|jgi:hypothetical protein